MEWRSLWLIGLWQNHYLILQGKKLQRLEKRASVSIGIKNIVSCVLCSILNISDIRFTKFRIIVLINAGWEWVQGEAGNDGDKKLKWLNTFLPHHLCGIENTHMRLGGSSWQTCISSHLDPLLTSFIYLPYQHMSKKLSIFFCVHRLFHVV